jgi:alanyl-tRNA synthetase
MNSQQIRERFLAYFAANGHRVVPSASLVPDDPTLLFTNAGMVQFKGAFLGVEERPYRRAASSQKCMRVSGKHNDLENVGPSPRHHTFFEMLGNFSFGDYFKADAIRFGWELMTEQMGIDPDRLVFTVFRDDDEAWRQWTEGIGVAPDRVLRMGEKTNFWMMADVGPCGPTSEIHYDFGRAHCTCGRDDCSVGLDNGCGRWLEVWNLVFMQHDQAPDGTSSPLPRPGVDTGMGFERITAIKQGVFTNYDTDLFVPILDRIQYLLGHDDATRAVHETAYRVMADHARAMAFLVTDGVLPGNEGRSYVLRLIMRRAMRFGMLAGFTGPFLPEVVDAVIGNMGGVYPDLALKSGWVRDVVAEEEARFERTLASGTNILDGLVADVERQGGRLIAGADVFRLYDTFGFPPDLTRAVAEEHGLDIDRDGFEAAMDEQRERARAGGVFGLGAGEDYYRRLGLPEVRFVGHDTTEAVGEVLALTVDAAPVAAAGPGILVEVVLDRTPFYAESGGQVGDTGTLSWADGAVRVTDTRSPLPGVIVHHGVVELGEIRNGAAVTAAIDVDRRLDVMRNHTGTHLLHRALQDVLGTHAQQRGSLVAADRMRFDFAHLKALTPSEVERIEQRVNEMIRADAPVGATTMALDDARQTGAMMLFGEKYGDAVRVVSVEGLSKELCGGTHLARTGQIGLFHVLTESAVGAGLRRIEAITGRYAERHVRERLALLGLVAERLKAPSVDDVPARIADLTERIRQLERALQAERATRARGTAESLADAVIDVDGAGVVAARIAVADVEALRGQVDALRDQLQSAVIVLGAVIDGKPRIVAAVTEDLVQRGLHAGKLVQAVASGIGGAGGGRPTLAEAGGRAPEALDRALAGVADHVRAMLAG